MGRLSTSAKYCSNSRLPSVLGTSRIISTYFKEKHRKYTSVPSANFSCLAVIASEIIQIPDSIGFVVLYVYDLPVGEQKCANNVLGNILKEWRQVYLGTPGVLRVISIVDIKGGAIENT